MNNENTPLLPDVANIIAVASGKGGVGKSTVAVNTAVALARKGFKVGLIDADIYGPSIPIMFNMVNEKPEIINIDGREVMQPIEKHGVKLLSIGFLVDPSQALVWRGPMASGALKQMFTDANWGKLDYLLIDMPPGTGDIHLTLVQTIPVTGAIMVTTPQQVALADARKGISLFQHKGIKVPVLGLIENMAYFTPEELPDNKYYIFGKDGGKQLCEELTIPFLGEIPLVQGICEGGDSGKPIATNDSVTAKAFDTLADNIIKQVDIRNTLLGPTRVVNMDAKSSGCGHKH